MSTLSPDVVLLCGYGLKNNLHDTRIKVSLFFGSMKQPLLQHQLTIASTSSSLSHACTHEQMKWKGNGMPEYLAPAIWANSLLKRDVLPVSPTTCAQLHHYRRCRTYAHRRAGVLECVDQAGGDSMLVRDCSHGFASKAMRASRLLKIRYP